MTHWIELPMAAAVVPRAAVPERRRASASAVPVLLRMLDEVDYGIVLLAAQGELRYANRLAALELAGDGPLRAADGRIAALDAAELGRLREALAAAFRGRRKLVTLGSNGHRLTLAVVPIDAGDLSQDQRMAMLLFSKRATCAPLTLTFFAGTMGLTATESSVLALLSRGVKPKQIARGRGVKLATVRTQIASIRGKTGAASIAELVSQVVDLPPFVPAVPHTGPAESDVGAPPGHAAVDLSSMAAFAC